MAFNIRQMLSGLFSNSENEAVNQSFAPQQSLLDKLGAVFNFTNPTPNKNSFQQQTALRQVATQVTLNDGDIKNQLRREAVREGVVTPNTQTEDNSAFYLAGGYRLIS